MSSQSSTTVGDHMGSAGNALFLFSTGERNFFKIKELNQNLIWFSLVYFNYMFAALTNLSTKLILILISFFKQRSIYLFFCLSTPLPWSHMIRFLFKSRSSFSKFFEDNLTCWLSLTFRLVHSSRISQHKKPHSSHLSL